MQQHLFLNPSAKPWESTSQTSGLPVLNYNFMVARFNTDGTLDATFGVGGIQTTPLGDPSTPSLANAVVIQPDGKIIAAGYDPLTDFALARYTTAGVLDTTFGTGGTVSTPLGNQARINAMALQSDGKIVVGGYVIVSEGLEDFAEFALARYFVDAIAPTPTSNACALRLINKYGTRVV